MLFRSMGKMNEGVLKRVRAIRAEHRKQEQVVQPGWEAAIEFFEKRDTMYKASNTILPALVKPPPETTAHLTSALAKEVCGGRAESEEYCQSRSFLLTGVEAESAVDKNEV